MGNFSTFLAVDFYNHDTKTTDLAAGDAPIYNTLFSFKNSVDDFYLKHLEKDTILVDVFLTPMHDQKAGKTIKIGSAKLHLLKLLERDYSFQAQEIVHETNKTGSKIAIGRLFYRMRMRKDLNEAIRWKNERTLVQAVKDPTITNTSGTRKVIEIEVKQGFNLAIQGPGQSKINNNIAPFFTYRFYTFDETISAQVHGCNPLFEHRRKFECDDNAEFANYMKKGFLKIDFIDESREI